MSELILAFDMGGSHVSSAVVGDAVGNIATSQIVSDTGLEVLLAVLEATGRAALNASELQADSLAGIGVAAPGPFDYDKGISLMEHKHTALYGHDLKASLASRFGVASDTVVFLNDASAFLVGEIERGSFYDLERVVGITLGTGIGSAFCINGKVVVLGAGVPADGYVYDLPWADGIVEDKLSTRCLVQTYKILAGEEISVSGIAERASHDPTARKVMSNFGSTLGQVLNIVLREFDPQLIILGGGITRSSALFLQEMEREFTSFHPKIHVCDALDATPLIGAAQYARSVFQNVSESVASRLKVS